MIDASLRILLAVQKLPELRISHRDRPKLLSVLNIDDPHASFGLVIVKLDVLFDYVLLFV